jgi:hypothetical protein
MRRFTQSVWAVTGVAAFGALFAVGVSGCGGGGGGGERTGTLRVAITDQAGSYASIHIAIREVRVVPAGSGETTTALPVIATFEPPLPVEIVALRFEHELLGTAQVPAGQYNQVRLVLAPNEAGQDPVNYLTLESDPATKLPLRTPSGQQSGLKILGQFEVVENQPQTIVLDFDPGRGHSRWRDRSGGQQQRQPG